MSSTDKLVIPAYNLSSEREFNEWVRNLRTMAKQQKYLLDIIEEGTIRPGAEREAEAVALHVRYKNVGVAEGIITARIDTYFENLSKTLSRQLYGALQNAVKGETWYCEMPKGLKGKPEYCYCLLYTSPSPRDKRQSRMPSSA